jgi:hypothetical protein
VTALDPLPAGDTVAVRMSETVRYEHTFPLAELAALLDVEATREAVFAALDEANDNYDTAEDADALLDHLITNHLSEVDSRDWVIRCSWRADHPVGQP